MGHGAGRGAGCRTVCDCRNRLAGLPYCRWLHHCQERSAFMSSAEMVQQAEQSPESSAQASHQPMGLAEFVVFTSAAMAINALATSIMLSALPDIAAAYALKNANAQQLVLTIFFAGFSL